MNTYQRGNLEFATENKEPEFTSNTIPVVTEKSILDTLLEIKIPGTENKMSIEERDRLTEILWSDGSMVFSNENKYLSYEIFTSVFSDKLKGKRILNTYSDMSFNEIIDQLISIFSTLDKNKSKAVFDLPTYINEKISYNKETISLKSKVNVVPGIHQCVKCGSYNTKTIIIQMRRGDEADTHKSTCLKCGKNWNEN